MLKPTKSSTPHSKQVNKLVLFIFLFLLVASVVSALELPVGLQKIKEHNQEQAMFFAENLTFLIAYLGGILSFLLPCTIAILPGFFAYTFKSKSELTKKTLIFFLGFSLVFVVLGLIAGVVSGSIGEFRVAYTDDSSLPIDLGDVITVIGFVMLFLGGMMIAGKGFPILTVDKKPDPSNWGIFVWGILLSIGWSACSGPIVTGILLMASLLGNIAKSGLLLFFYSLGVFTPFFLISIFYDRFNLGQSALLRGKTFTFGKYSVHSTNLISGLFLIIIGWMFIAYEGTTIVNQTFVYTTAFIYRAEDALASWAYANILGGLLLLGLIGLVVWSIRRRK